MRRGFCQRTAAAKPQGLVPMLRPGAKVRGIDSGSVRRHMASYTDNLFRPTNFSAITAQQLLLRAEVFDVKDGAFAFRFFLEDGFKRHTY